MAMKMSAQSGNWSSTATWGGSLPAAGDDVHIHDGHEIVYDLDETIAYGTVMSDIGTKLTWRTAGPTKLYCHTLMLLGTSIIVDESEHPTEGQPKHDIVFRAIAGLEPGAGPTLGGIFMGPTRIHGYKKKGHLRFANNSVAAGATSIQLTGLANSGWRVGDTIIILGTEYELPESVDSDYSGPASYWGRFKSGSTFGTRTMDEFQFGQDEERVISNIVDDVVHFTTPLAYSHTGMTGTLKDGKAITVRPVVGIVSRSIRFRASGTNDLSDLQQRPHLMFMGQPDVDLRYFESQNLGRTATDPTLVVADLPYTVDMAGGIITINKILASNGGAPLENLENVRGRYGIHLHWCGGPYLSSPQINLIGASCWAPSGEVPLPGWGIVQHGTRAAIEDCVVSNVRGAGMVSELGNEIGQWVSNLVTGCRSDGDRQNWGTRHETHSNHNGSNGVAYENQSRAIIQWDNIAGSSKYGWIYHHQKDHRWLRGFRGGQDLRLVDGLLKGASIDTQAWYDEFIGAAASQIPPFIRNEAHACRHGFSVIHRIGKEAGPIPTPMLMERFHCLNVPFAWQVPMYSNRYYQKDCLWQGPLNMMEESRGAEMGTVSWDWNFSNIHMRNYFVGIEDSGAGLNYEGFLIDITMENVTNSVWRQAFTFQKSAMPADLEGVMGPMDTVSETTTTRTARLQPYSILNSATDLPQPYPLAPYGRKLPVGYSPVPPDGSVAPYFVPGDGTNGLASTDPVTFDLTLDAGGGRDQGRIYGIIRDSVGDRRWPDWQSSESFPTQVTKKSHQTLGEYTPEQLLAMWGCYQDPADSLWKTRVWFRSADRHTHVRFAWYFDFTLNNVQPQLLAAHDLGAVPTEPPPWPDQLEAVPDPRPLTPIARTLRFLSRTTLENVAGQPLLHTFNTWGSSLIRYSIVAGSDAAQFSIVDGALVWANGTKTAGNSFSATIRAEDEWGNFVEAIHTVVVVPSTRVFASISDNFSGTSGTELTTHNANYLMLTGPASSFVLSSTPNTLTLAGTTAAAIDLGSLGTSEMEVSFQFNQWNSGHHVLFRMVDENNWIGMRRVDFPTPTSFDLRMCVGGSQSTIAKMRNEANRKVLVRLVGDRIVVLLAGTSSVEPKTMYPIDPNGTALIIPEAQLAFDEPGAMLLPANAPRGTKVGLLKGTSATTNWLDNFLAVALPG